MAGQTHDINELKRRMQGSVSVLKTELGGLRTGRASAHLLDPIHVDAYGSSMPLNQVATVSIPQPRMISVQVWDRSMVHAVEKAIAAFEAEDKTNAPPKDATLFYGASNIRLWKSLPQRFGKTKVINRGFGGSQLSDCVHFADRVVIPYAPKTIYLNAGGNDLHAGRTPEQVLADFKAFVAKVRAALPQTQISYLSIPTSPSRWSEVEQVKRANQLITDYAKADGKLGFINFFPQLLGADGKPRVCERVWISSIGCSKDDKTEQTGKLTAGAGDAGKCSMALSSATA